MYVSPVPSFSRGASRDAVSLKTIKRKVLRGENENGMVFH